jgi:hypothetical protein
VVRPLGLTRDRSKFLKIFGLSRVHQSVTEPVTICIVWRNDLEILKLWQSKFVDLKL